MPSKRSFAKNLGISVITVENSYAQLQAEGYIYSKPKSGFYVADISGMVEKRTVTPKEKVIKAGERTISRKAGMQKNNYIADFVTNHTKPENFPFSIRAKLMREVISAREDELMETSPSGGSMELRTAIAEYLRQFRNMTVEPEQIIIGAGTEYLYTLLIQLLGRDDIYAVEDPGYRKLSQIYESNGVEYRFIPMDYKGMIIPELEKSGAEVVHITPSHHFPTGIVSPVSRRYELIAWATDADNRYIIEDDYDSELRLEGKPIPTMQSMDVAEKVIYMNTFTKTLSSTIRISYMVLPPHLLQRFRDRLSFYSCTVSNFEQYTLAQFITQGYYERHINRMRNYYRKVRDELLSEIDNSSLRDKVEIMEEESGLHLLMKLNTDMPDSILLEQGRRNGLYLACLSQYYSGSSGSDKQHTLIMNYTGIDRGIIKEAVRLLESTII